MNLLKMATSPGMQLPVIITDLLASKKFKVLLALIALWAEPVRASLGLDQEALKYLTIAFCVYLVSQGFHDLGEELRRAAECFCTNKAATPPEEEDKETP